MEKLSKTSTTYYLSEYLEDLSRAGVRDIYRGDATRPAATNAPKPTPQNAPLPQSPPIAASAPLPPTPQIAQSAPLSEKPSSDAPNAAERSERLRIVAQDVARCVLCPALVANRTQTVFGSGDPCAELVFVGEGPGADEDAQGLPFVGRSGKLLTDMIEKGMGIPRSSVFICNVVRCRPPQNRNPSSDEARACRPFLDATLEIVRPKFICCLGSIAATNLLGVETTIGRLRGKLHDYNGAKVVCTYHPAYLLRNPPAKKETWKDLQLLMSAMGLSVPEK